MINGKSIRNGQIEETETSNFKAPNVRTRKHSGDSKHFSDQKEEHMTKRAITQ